MTPNTNEGTTKPMKTMSEDPKNIDYGTASDCMSQAIFAVSCTECGGDATFGYSDCTASSPSESVQKIGADERLCMECAKRRGLPIE